MFALFLGLKHNQGLVDMGKNIVGGVSNVSRESVEPVRLFSFFFLKCLILFVCLSSAFLSPSLN